MRMKKLLSFVTAVAISMSCFAGWTLTASAEKSTNEADWATITETTSITVRMNSIIDGKKTSTKLQTLRKNCNYSQRELSEKSGVNLRTLQQYEAGSKDINKAASLTLLQLSRALGCRMEDLMD